MKTAQLLKTTIFLILLAIGLLFNGCANDNPMSMSTDNTVDGKTIKFISLIGNDANTLSKVTSAQKWIQKSMGGTLHIHHIANTGSPKPEVIVDLLVPSFSIDRTKTISVTFDDADNMGEADLVFGPHGTQYSSPALLTMECKNFDLSGINPNNVKFFYVNENGVWEEHATHEIIVDLQLGLIRVVDAELHHFSRYAIGETP